MRLTNFSDYAFRVLMYAAARSDRLITIEETAEVYGISRAHLMKGREPTHPGGLSQGDPRTHRRPRPGKASLENQVRRRHSCHRAGLRAGRMLHAGKQLPDHAALPLEGRA
jgi:hypothetical protein